MEGTRFDYLARSLASRPRRGVLAGLAGVLGLAAVGIPAAEAKKRKKKRKPKVVFNQYGCVDVGKECGGNSANCCSGICQSVKVKKRKGKRRKKKSVCVSHNVGTCPPAYDSCGVIPVPCGNNAGSCLATSGKGVICANTTENGQSGCRSCNKDADCQVEFGPGAACVVCHKQCSQTQSRACFAAAA